MTEPYNPLEKKNLALSIEGALLEQPAVPIANATRMPGAGVYAIYYAGDFAPYALIKCDPINDQFARPIYVGKAIPEGGRTGGMGMSAASGSALAKRLGNHRRSIDQAQNLSLSDFWVRYLLVDDIWIPLGENVLIETFQPLWNVALSGFGNNAPGKGREQQVKSPWDALHPGRSAFEKLPIGDLTQELLLRRVADHLSAEH